MNFLKKITFLSVFLLLTSCLKGVDFDQANQLYLTPSYNLALINFTIPQTALVDRDTNTEFPSVSRKTELTSFSTDVAQQNLEKVIIHFEIENTFNREFIAYINFLDGDDDATYPSIPLNVTAGDQNFEQDVEIIVAENADFLNSRQIEVVVELQPGGTPVDVLVENTFNFKSATTLFYNIH